MGIIAEFKEFAIRGNMLDLAVGVIMGAAFGGVVNSLVTDIIMPPIGMAAGQMDFKDLFISLNGQTYPSLTAAKTAGAPVLAYGLFINTFINLLIVAFAVFLLIKQVNRFRKPAGATTKECPLCASNIPLKARRCPACTSDLAAASGA
jgi:large conductance mechanosensitive channel